MNNRLAAISLFLIVALGLIFAGNHARLVSSPNPAQRVLDINLSKPDALQVNTPIYKPATVRVEKPTASASALSPGCEQHVMMVDDVAEEVFGINPPTARLLAQLDQESRCKPRAVSHAGARGIAQFMPRTAALMARRYPELAPADPTDEEWAIRAQAYLMRDLLAHYDGAKNSCDQWSLALSAYNGGEVALKREQLKASNPLVWAGSVRPERSRSQAAWNENRDYVDQVLLKREPALIESGYSIGAEPCV